MTPSQGAPAAQPTSEAGFTLVEALVSIVVLVFGLIAVTNLLLVAASSNAVGNVSTASAAIASQQLEVLRGRSFEILQNAVAGGAIGGVTSDTTGCTIAGYGTGDPGYSVGNCYRDDVIPGVGLIHTRFQISPGSSATANPDPQIVFIRVRSEGTGPLARSRSRAEFTVFRTCTDQSKGCP